MPRIPTIRQSLSHKIKYNSHLSGYGSAVDEQTRLVAVDHPSGLARRLGFVAVLVFSAPSVCGRRIRVKEFCWFSDAWRNPFGPGPREAAELRKH